MGRRPSCNNSRSGRIISLRRLRSENTTSRTKEETECEDVESSSRSWSPSTEYEEECISSLPSSDNSAGSDDESSFLRVRRSKSVRFGQCNIRRYSQVMGEHPCCQVGCPLELGWEYEAAESCPVDAYEASRTSHLLPTRLTQEQRRQILLLENYSDGEMKRACRRLHRDRRCNQKVKNEFFSASASAPPPPPPPTPPSS